MDKNIWLWIIGIGIVIALGMFIQKSYDIFATLPAGQYIQFRTTDLTYTSSTAIAYATNCGDELIPYGYSTSYGRRTGLCTTDRTLLYNGLSESIPVTYIMDVPGGFNTGGTNPARLYAHTTDTTLRYICDDDGIQYESKKYNSGDSDASNVDTRNTETIDSTKEIICGTACIPSCTGKVCGDNGCGGSCGTCQSGYTCSNGQCVSGGVCLITDTNSNNKVDFTELITAANRWAAGT